MKQSDLASTRFLIHSVFRNFRLGEWIQKVADSYARFIGYVWTEEKLRIQKYPDTCERGLKIKYL